MKLFQSSVSLAALVGVASAANTDSLTLDSAEDFNAAIANRQAAIAARDGRNFNFIGPVGTREPLDHIVLSKAEFPLDGEVSRLVQQEVREQRGGSSGGKHCITEHDTVQTQECRTTYDKQCHQNYQTEFETAYDQKCDTTFETICQPVPRQVPDQECITVHDEVCTKETQEDVETHVEQRCHVNHHEEVEEVEEVVSHQALKKKPHYGYKGYGYQQKGYKHGVYGQQAQRYGGYGGHSHSVYGVHPGGGRSYQSFKMGRGKRAAEAEPQYGYYDVETVTEVHSKPVCRKVEEQVCEEIPITTPKFFEVPKCEQVPRLECRETYKTVLDTKCQQVPKEMCAEVPRQVSRQIPFEVCEDIPREECQYVDKLVPREVCEQYSS